MWVWIVLALLLFLIGGVAYYYHSQKSKKDKEKDGKSSNAPPFGPIPMDDFVTAFNRLRPDSTHMDILLAVICTKSVLDRATEEIDKVEELRERRKKQIVEEEKSKKGALDFDDLVNAGGWGDENEDDEANDEEGEYSEAVNAIKRAKEEERRKEAELDRLRKATGKTLPPMEGLDKGVLGQEWVVRILKENDAWPPHLGEFGNEVFDYKPANRGRRSLQKLKPLDHPAFRRCLCMTMGRLHSSKLNGHPQLVEAGTNNKADETYFKGTMEFRQRIALIIEASIRIAVSLQSFTLLGTLVETLSAFKVGCDPSDPKSLPWFNGNMARQYNTLPRLEIGTLYFEEPREDSEGNSDEKEPERLTELVAGQHAVVVVPVDRKHAESFTKVKIEQCKTQGIHPQMALQGYRETWWFLVRWEPTSKETVNDASDIPRKFIDQLDSAVAKRLEDNSPNMRVRTAFPMMVQNIAQKSGAVKVRIEAPKNPGHYKFVVAVKSQDFLGADQELSIEADVAESPGEATNNQTADSPDAVSEPKKDK